MKKNLMSMATNWHVWVLFVVLSVATVLVAGEPESGVVLVASKCLGIGVGAVGVQLFRHWAASGKIDDWLALMNNE